MQSVAATQSSASGPERRWPGALALAAALLLLVIVGADRLIPVDLNPAPGATVVLDRTGEPLRAFADAAGIWRIAVTPGEVSANYLEALIAFEDRWFEWHPGVNPLALLRAAGQWLQSGRIISGGSTLTMQVARLRYPGYRGLTGKLAQVLRALQLEWHYDKSRILGYYLTHAPFGGALEGVEAASRAYFGHSADLLTDAQAALLAGLPQAPSRYRPDRAAGAARLQRQKVLDRWHRYGTLSAEAHARASVEPVFSRPYPQPFLAPLLARRLRLTTDAGTIGTFIRRDLQQSFETLARQYHSRLPEGASIAMLAMAHGSGEVVAYVGSAGFFEHDRYGQIDMVQAARSPGSTLKPFIVGLALDQGLIHSESLLMDVPLAFAEYRPVNFDQRFRGPVSVSEALQASLNMPAVQLLEQIGPRTAFAALVTAGAELRLPDGAAPSLAIALGGVSTDLESLVTLYSSLGNAGEALRPRLSRAEPREGRQLLSPEAGWIVRTILLDGDRAAGGRPALAVKTGTSSGLRDTWALAVTGEHTLGVWIGQPDNTAMTGHLGRATAVPLLRAMAQRLAEPDQRPAPRPGGVTRVGICWPGGQTIGPLCDEVRQAWTIADRTPTTLMATLADTPTDARPWLSVRVAPDTGLRVPAGCLEQVQTRQFPRWPDPLQPWLPREWRTLERLPDQDPRCTTPSGPMAQGAVRIENVGSVMRLRSHDSTMTPPTLRLRAIGGEPDWYWFIDGRLLSERGPELTLQPERPGRYRIQVSDRLGHSDRLDLTVEAPEPDPG